jgi:dTDP-4-amino-4,6-dideoxygalactose transaminase
VEVPFVDLSRLELSLYDEIARALDRTVRGGNLILGPEVRAFEKEFADFCGSRHAVGVSSGTDALFLGMKACGVGEGDLVITAANTFIATFIAISMCGAVPVPVDVEPDFHTIDTDSIEEAASPRTRAIIPVHLYGQAADMDRVMRVANERGLVVIEDACQAHGALYRGSPCGTFGKAGCFSFYPTKNLGGVGDGGMVVTDDERVSSEVAMLRNYGQRKKNVHLEIGYNMRMDELMAAALRLKLESLDRDNLARVDAAMKYRERLDDIDELALPKVREGNSHVYHLFVIRCERRNALREYLKGKGVGTGIHYPEPPYLQDAYRFLDHSKGEFPVTERLAEEVLSLPMFPGLTTDEIDYVSDRIREYYA